MEISQNFVSFSEYMNFNWPLVTFSMDRINLNWDEIRIISHMDGRLFRCFWIAKTLQYFFYSNRFGHIVILRIVTLFWQTKANRKMDLIIFMYLCTMAIMVVKFQVRRYKLARFLKVRQSRKQIMVSYYNFKVFQRPKFCRLA